MRRFSLFTLDALPAGALRCTPQAFLVPEVDGLRIVTNRSTQLLRRVNDRLVEIFQIGSTSPGATLFDARTLFDQKASALGQESGALESLSSCRSFHDALLR